MKRGYVFSLLIALLLGLMILVAQYYLVERPTAEIYPGIIGSRGQVASLISHELAGELGASRGESLSIEQSFPAPDLSAELWGWGQLLLEYENETTQNATLDLSNHSNAGDGVWLAGNGAEYRWQGRLFSLAHSGDYLLVNGTTAAVDWGNCSFDAAGEVETRVSMGGYDGGAGYTSAGNAYGCFLNFSAGGNVTVEIGVGGILTIDYSNSPEPFAQRVSFNQPSAMYLVFDGYESATGASPGWDEDFPGGKRYASLAGMNFVVADEDNDGKYDHAFVDADGNGDFGDSGDAWYLKEGIVALNGKVFYMRFDLDGNWIKLYNAPGAVALGSAKGVWV